MTPRHTLLARTVTLFLSGAATLGTAAGADLPPSSFTASGDGHAAYDACLAPGAPTDTTVPLAVTIDGRPMGPGAGPATETDRRQCLDVLLAQSQIQMRYDPLETQPFLNVLATPGTVRAGEPTHFGTYSNYVAYVERAEVRVFAAGQSVQQTPIAVLPVTPGRSVDWTPPVRAAALEAIRSTLGVPTHLTYVLRVIARDGHFDETAPKRLDLGEPGLVADPARRTETEAEAIQRAWAENALALRNIAVHGGAVTVSGAEVRPGYRVTVLGAEVPVDADGRWVARQILPAGPQSVPVNVLNEAGEGLSFTRNLSIATNDHFFIALADLTGGERTVSGPVQLVTGDPTLARTGYVDGHLAFYYKGLVKGSWLLTAAADTQEQPLRDLFSNFARKDPQYLLRRIDPDRYYPVYGDDSTLVQDAPTSGKFYVRLEKDGNSVLWGNFQTAMSGTEFLSYSRTLYGVDARFASADTTRFGEKSTKAEGFWADSGTVNARQEFRGTGGSVYYLGNLDVAVGSEQVTVQVRDKDSGIVRSVTRLVPAQDYDINYLQGRILLHDALPTTADTATFVHDSTLTGDPVYLVVTYEFVPSFSSPSSLASGGHASQWFGDHVQLGVSGYHQGETGATQTLKGADLTLRYQPGTYLRTEVAHSDGVGTPMLSSITGGITNQVVTTTGEGAEARRVEAGIDLAEISAGKGRVALYHQDRDANFSGPGQLTPGVGIRQDGGAASLPLNATTQVVAKVDNTRSSEQTSDVAQLGVEHEIDAHWRVAVGARRDDLNTRVPNASALLSQTGERTDVALTIGYHPALPSGATITAATVTPGVPAAASPGTKTGTLPGLPATGSANSAQGTNLSSSPTGLLPNTATGTAPPAGGQALWLGRSRAPWDVYAFGQDTVSHSGSRPVNNRGGLGGSLRITDRFRLGGEVSDGSLGVGGKVSGDYRIDNQSNVYLNYTLAADSPDALNVGRAGALTSGARYRYSDSTSVYGEERMLTGTGPSGLTHAYGVDFRPLPRWNFGLKFERGTVSDPLAGDQSVDAIAGSVGYTAGKVRYASALEWRTNDASHTGRSRTILSRNSVTYQVDPDWRALAKANWSQTSGTTSAALDAQYREFVLGAAYRPVLNDRWNTLFKITYLTDLPSTTQLATSAIATPYAQRSKVFDIDAMRQLTDQFSLGGKFAIRTGELQATATHGPWFSSTARLYILRGDLLIVREWDALLEVRRLEENVGGDHQDGVLVAGYRHFGDHVKAGLGFNFTNYSDNLTDLSFRSKGVFLNVLGKY